MSDPVVDGVDHIVDHDQDHDLPDIEFAESGKPGQMAYADDGSGHASKPSDDFDDWNMDDDDPNFILTEKERAAIFDYTYESYKFINPAMRSSNIRDGIRIQIEVLKSALTKLREHDGIVFRGVRLPPEIVERYQPGCVVTEAAFTSTTTDRDVTFRGNVEFRIMSKTGKRLHWQTEYREEEEEVLFLPGTRFEVFRPPRVAPDGGGWVVIELVEREGRADEGVAGGEFSTPADLGLEPLSDVADLESGFDHIVDYVGF
ncbi:ADP-ribosyltransferase [Nocardia sp. NBC_00403]|uniref:ADP-ribosyltransferase n=1 Tax=Nocardia sp. NBC_00403 TaxID=2975990 RepID=UPI002E1CD9A7